MRVIIIIRCDLGFKKRCHSYVFLALFSSLDSPSEEPLPPTDSRSRCKSLYWKGRKPNLLLGRDGLANVGVISRCLKSTGHAGVNYHIFNFMIFVAWFQSRLRAIS